MRADLSSRGLWDMAAVLRQRWRPILDQRRVEGQGGQVHIQGGLWTQLAPSGGLPLGDGDPLQVDGSFHRLKQEVPLLGVKLKTALAGVAPPPGLEGEGRLNDRKHIRDWITPDLILKILNLS